MLGRRMLDPNLARSMLSGELTEGRGQDRVHSRRVGALLEQDCFGRCKTGSRRGDEID